MKKMVNLGACIFIICALIGVERAAAAGFDYGDAVGKALLFFEAQRSGRLHADHRVKWRGDSGLKDGFLQGVDLVGGYYDAGDHVKFGLPMAFTCTMLAWGAIDFRKEITELNQMGPTLWAIRWGTDYFLKAHSESDVLWAQVGDGNTDHYCWERPEDMTTPRTAYKLDLDNPGSDLAGETAAALAAASIAFKPYNASYSSILLIHAKQLFSFADSYRGFYDDSIPNAKQFYTSSGYSDELLWAATWLYRATGDEFYLKYVVDNAENLGGTGWAMKEFSWDNKYAGVQILLSKILLEGNGGAYTSTLRQYQAKANYFACACLLKNDGYNIQKTPGGLMYVREWNNLQYASAAAFLLAVYSDYLAAANSKLSCPEGQIQPQELLNFAKSQADYILGNNPKSMSYVVGYGERYPVHVHHRGASIASIFVLHSVVECSQGFETWYQRSEANPNVVYGALVGGPDQNDNFYDDRSNYEQTEPTISGSAPLIGLFSKLHGVCGNKGYHSPKVPKVSPLPSKETPGAAVQFLHSITNSWMVGTKTYYRHKVTIKNVSKNPVRDLKMLIENLSGSIWGLIPSPENNCYELPEKILEPDFEYSFVYVQEGPQAMIKVLSYH